MGVIDENKGLTASQHHGNARAPLPGWAIRGFATSAVPVAQLAQLGQHKLRPYLKSVSAGNRVSLAKLLIGVFLVWNLLHLVSRSSDSAEIDEQEAEERTLTTLERLRSLKPKRLNEVLRRDKEIAQLERQREVHNQYGWFDLDKHITEEQKATYRKQAESLKAKSHAVATRVYPPAFVFGGQWAERKTQAKLQVSPTKFCHAPSLVYLPDRVVLAAWIGGTYEGLEDTAVYVANFTSGAWGPPRVAGKVHRKVPYAGKDPKPVVRPQGGEPHWNPVLFCADKESAETGQCHGALWLFFKVGWETSSWQTFVTTSTNGGRTWARASPLVEGDRGGRGPVKNKPLMLSDGSWLAGASLEGPPGARPQNWRVFVDRSTDSGATWHRSPELAHSEPRMGVTQPTLWESSAGQVHVLMRSSKHRRAVLMRSDSSDGGRSWSSPRKTALPSNNCGIDIARLPFSGTLVLAYNPVTEQRTPLQIAISTDNGATWECGLNIESEMGRAGLGHGKDHEFSYPSIIPWPSYAQGDNGAPLSDPMVVEGEEGFSMVYSWHRKRIAFVSMSLADLRSRCKPLDELEQRAHADQLSR